MPFQLSEELVDKLLDKLSSDNEFRAAFQKNPRIAMAYLGHDAAAKAGENDQGAWMCMKCDKLASPEAIKASRDELRKQLLTSKAVLNPIRLQA
jgi:putative modified peptide